MGICKPHIHSSKPPIDPPRPTLYHFEGNCRNCGAPIISHTCSYCGTKYFAHHNIPLHVEGSMGTGSGAHAYGFHSVPPEDRILF